MEKNVIWKMSPELPKNGMMHWWWLMDPAHQKPAPGCKIFL